MTWMQVFMCLNVMPSYHDIEPRIILLVQASDNSFVIQTDNLILFEYFITIAKDIIALVS
jgi:hypothetical protein